MFKFFIRICLTNYATIKDLQDLLSSACFFFLFELNLLPRILFQYLRMKSVRARQKKLMSSTLKESTTSSQTYFLDLTGVQMRAEMMGDGRPQVEMMTEDLNWTPRHYLAPVPFT